MTAPMASVPLIKWRPYWGVSSNADTLSESLTAKAKIVEEVTGVSLALVQGAPSGSSRSGGTHLGWGNAADWSLVSRPRGMSITDACALVSQAFRSLTCLSYVRGLDVDGDGVKDDTFDWHVHVIDYENRGALTDSQASQLRDYAAGRDALVGGRRDREKRPARTYTLAEWLSPGGGSSTPSLTKDIIMAITNAQQSDFNALLKTALNDRDIQIKIGQAALGNTYGDIDGDGKADTAGQLVRDNALVGRVTQDRVNHVLDRLEAFLNGQGAQ